jgi:hypothetical protein
MMKAVSISETSVTFYETTRRNVPEDSNVQKNRSFFEMLHRPGLTGSYDHGSEPSSSLKGGEFD